MNAYVAKDTWLSASWKRHRLPVALWTLLCGIFFATLLLGIERLPDGDFTGQFHAYALFQARELTQGQFPVWSPGSHGGFPFAGDPQAAAFYPPRLLGIFLSLPWGFSLYVLQIEAILHVWLAGLFTYALAFHMAGSRRAALLAAVAFGLGGYLTSYPLLQLAILETVVWLPLALMLVRKAARAAHPAAWLVAAGLTLALSALAGHPQTFMHVAYVTGIYFLFCALQARWTARWLVVGSLLLVSVSAGVSAAMWLPALQVAIHSTRASVSYEFVANGQPLLHYLQTFTPGLLTLWSPEYVGLVTVILAFYAWFGRRNAARVDVNGADAGRRAVPERDEIVFWSLLALFAAWLALGDDGVLFRLFYRLAPGFSLFRQQERLVGIANLSLALLAALGFARWLSNKRDRRRALLGEPAAILLLGVALCGLFILAAPFANLMEDGAVWLRQLLIACASLSLLAWAKAERWAGIALLVLLSADLYLALGASLSTQPGPVAEYWQRPAWLAILKDDQRENLAGRIDTRNRFPVNVGEVYALEDIRGISPLRLQMSEEIMALPEYLRWRLLDVEHVVSATPLAEPAELLATVDEALQPGQYVDAALYRVPASQGRAWLSYEPVRVAGPQEALSYLVNPEFDAAREVVLHTQHAQLDAVPAPNGGRPTAPGEVQTRRLQANALAMEVATDAPALLVISEWHYPGWRAEIDGRPAPIHPANYAFQAVVVPPGQHTITLRFVPFIVIAGALVSALSLVGAMVVLLRWHPSVEVRPDLGNRARRLPSPALPYWLAEALQRLSSLVAARSRFILWGVVLAAATARLWRLGLQELRGDEAFSYLMANRPLLDVVPALIAGADPHPPLHYLLLSAWMQLSGDTELAMRMITALAGVLLVPLMYRLGKAIWSKNGGLLLALLLAVSQSQIWLSQDVRSQYMLSLLFNLLGTLLLVRALHEPGVGHWAQYSIVAALAMYSHFYSVFALLAHGVYVMVTGRRHFVSWVTAGLVAFAMFAPWLAASVAGWSGQLFDAGSRDLSAYLEIVLGELLVGPPLNADLSGWVMLVAVLVGVAGWMTLYRRRRSWALLAGSWLGMSIAGIFLIRLRRATFNPFYLAVAAPAWWLLFTAGVRALWGSSSQKYSWRRVVAFLAVLAVVSLNLLSWWRYVSEPSLHGRSQGYRQVATAIEANFEDNDLFLAHFPDPALTYYLRNVTIPLELVPSEQEQTADQIEGQLQSLADEYDRLWFVPVHNSNWDPDDVVFRWLDYHLLLERRHIFESLTLEAYRPLRSARGRLTALDNDVNGQLRLVGAYVTVNGEPVSLGARPATIPAGAELNVSLVWHALGEIPQNYTVFVHLLDPAGQLIAQHDGVPAHGTRPTETWQPAERLLDEHALVIPQQTTVSGAMLIVGLYDATTGERQQFDVGTDAIIMGRFDIVSPQTMSERGGP